MSRCVKFSWKQLLRSTKSPARRNSIYTSSSSLNHLGMHESCAHALGEMWRCFFDFVSIVFHYRSVYLGPASQPATRFEFCFGETAFLVHLRRTNLVRAIFSCRNRVKSVFLWCCLSYGLRQQLDGWTWSLNLIRTRLSFFRYSTLKAILYRLLPNLLPRL
jgi:hypothetical protein